MNFKEQLKDYIELVNTRLSSYLDYENGYNSTLIESMKYSLFAGGKRLRPVLALASYDLFGDHICEVMPYACALEMIHTYSLIHDDLPAMDDDDYRRGKLTNHKIYGEGIAILAGDGLLSYAFEIMLDDASKQKDPGPYIRSIKEIANAVGISGMIAGQTVDLESEGKVIDKKILEYIHLNKTAALIVASLKTGAIIGRAPERDVKCMEQAGLNLGLAFQIRDDILDVTGDKGKLGKSIGSDIDRHKSTYPALFGLETSVAYVKELTENANSLLVRYKDRSDFLLELSNYLTKRES
ncbi:MAG: polyprenyl synthetase family protein [Natronincolaceae bacterium]|jgi:geranylgeranyl diphosphate synthase type II|nr:polyprenyl synthetase family protein [Bacillota bacterium]NLK90856.1 polyprenyl synthetase family protein [Clostridiales bacterium]